MSSSISLNFAEGSLKDYVIMVSYLCCHAPYSLPTLREEEASSGKSPSRVVTLTVSSMMTSSSSRSAPTKLPVTRARDRTLRPGDLETWRLLGGLGRVIGVSFKTTTMKRKKRKWKMYFPSLS